MTPSTVLVSVLGLVWIGGGSAWLLRRRRYRLNQIHVFVLDLLGFPVEFMQDVTGRGGVPYAFLMPNLVIFGLFTFIPVILNFWVSLTGGSALDITQRPFVGFANYQEIFACETILTPKTCSNAGYAFWTGMFNTLIYVVIQVPVLVLASLATALVLNRSMAGRAFWRAMYFYPVMLSPVVIANIWSWILDRKGALNAVLADSTETISALSAKTYADFTITMLLAVALLATGYRIQRRSHEPSAVWAAIFGLIFVAICGWANLPGAAVSLPDTAGLWVGLVLAGILVWAAERRVKWLRAMVVAYLAAAALQLLTIQFDSAFDLGVFRPVNWLVTPNTGWPTFWLVFVYTWSNMGFYMLILLAGLQAIPTDLYEAASMDGTRPFRVFSQITLPLLAPTLLVVVVLVLIRSFQMFDEAYLLTGGGPGRETQMIVQNIFETAFGSATPQYGIASAASILMALVIAVFTFIQLVTTRRNSGI